VETMVSFSNRLRAAPAAPGPESGMTLIEVLIASVMALVVVGAATGMLISALQKQPDVTERADQVREAQVAVEKLVTQIRQGVVGTATVVNSGSSSTLTLETYVDGRCGTTTVSTGTKCKVVFQCQTEVCKRTTGTSTTSTETILTEVTNANTVFESLVGPSPCGTSAEVVNFVEVRLELKSRKGGATKLQDGAALRSCS
jgi:Tfp pilus assembly protein PilW